MRMKTKAKRKNCWILFHDWKRIKEFSTFGISGIVKETFECRRCGKQASW